MVDGEPGAPRQGTPRIEDYALVGDLETAALIAGDGSIDWLCLPRFDSPSCFARIVGDEQAGRWLLAPSDEVTSSTRRYRGDTLVLETEFTTATGTVRVTDAMPPRDRRPDIVRMAECLDGEVEMQLRLSVRFLYGRSVPWVRRVQVDGDDGIRFLAGPDSLTLHGDLLPRPLDGQRVHGATFTARPGQRHTWSLQWAPSHEEPSARVDVPAAVERTAGYWQDWIGQCRYDGPREDLVRRSLLTLKALTHAPTGGLVAAPTTSLPEALGGTRNWDYRFCWLRDAALTLSALSMAGYGTEAESWRAWLLRAMAGDPADLQIMYGIAGERHLLEWQVDWLPGYAGSSPVRVGNAAYRQSQLDVYGHVMDALHHARLRGLAETADSWSLQCALLAWLEKNWNTKDNGLWEVRGPARHFTHSKVMVWVAFDRGVRAVERFGLDGPVQRWRELRDTVHREVCEKGWNAEVGAFTQYFGATATDAALLVMPRLGFLPADDERVTATVEAIGRELKRGDFVDRYSTGEGEQSVDGLSGREGAFLMCSFWYVQCLALMGRQDEAGAMFDRLCDLANDVGLLSEEYDDRDHRFLGNFPQAFSHLALVDAALMLVDPRPQL